MNLWVIRVSSSLQERKRRGGESRERDGDKRREREAETKMCGVKSDECVSLPWVRNWLHSLLHPKIGRWKSA